MKVARVPLNRWIPASSHAAIPECPDGRALGKGDDELSEIGEKQGDDEKPQNGLQKLVPIHDPDQEEHDGDFAKTGAHGAERLGHPDHFRGLHQFIFAQVEGMSAHAIVNLERHKHRGDEG